MPAEQLQSFAVLTAVAIFLVLTLVVAFVKAGPGTEAPIHLARRKQEKRSRRETDELTMHDNLTPLAVEESKLLGNHTDLESGEHRLSKVGDPIEPPKEVEFSAPTASE